LLHNHSSQQSCLVVVIKLLNHSITPRFRKRYEPNFDVVEKAKPDQIAHTTRVPLTTIEHSLVINLLVVRKPQTAPDRPDGVYRALTSLVQNWANPTAARSQIDAIQTVESNWATQLARTDVIHLVNFVNKSPNLFRVFLAFGRVPSSASMGQFFSTEDSINRAK